MGNAKIFDSQAAKNGLFHTNSMRKALFDLRAEKTKKASKREKCARQSQNCQE